MHLIAMILPQIVAMAVIFCYLVYVFQGWAAVGQSATRKIKDSFLNDRRPRMNALCNSITLWEDFCCSAAAGLVHAFAQAETLLLHLVPNDGMCTGGTISSLLGHIV